jgi:hypothetical protein
MMASKLSIPKGKLALPEGIQAPVSHYVAGMRCVVMYQINWDGWLIRFDTFVDGEQRNIGWRASLIPWQDGQIRARTVAQLADSLSAHAERMFLAGDGAKGPQAGEYLELPEGV